MAQGGKNRTSCKACKHIAKDKRTIYKREVKSYKRKKLQKKKAFSYKREKQITKEKKTNYKRFLQERKMRYSDERLRNAAAAAEITKEKSVRYKSNISEGQDQTCFLEATQTP